jgi:hypothetical protein
VAITYRTSTAGGGTTGTGNRSGAAITPVANDLFIVVGTFTGCTNTAPTCSDNNNSGTYTRIFAGLYNASADMFCAFVRDTPLPNTTSTTVTVTTGSNTAGEIITIAWSGALRYGGAAIRQWAIQENQASGGTPAPAFLQAALTNNATLAGMANGSTSPIMTPNASWTERQDANQTSPACAHEVSTRDSGFTGTTITFGATSGSNFGSYAIELDDRAQRAGLDLTLMGVGT